MELKEDPSLTAAFFDGSCTWWRRDERRGPNGAGEWRSEGRRERRRDSRETGRAAQGEVRRGNEESDSKKP